MSTTMSEPNTTISDKEKKAEYNRRYYQKYKQKIKENNKETNDSKEFKKCELCKYKTKYKHHMTRHINLCHK